MSLADLVRDEFVPATVWDTDAVNELMESAVEWLPGKTDRVPTWDLKS